MIELLWRPVLAWHSFDFPGASEKVDFVDGLKTIAGNEDLILCEGLAIHTYLGGFLLTLMLMEQYVELVLLVLEGLGYAANRTFVYKNTPFDVVAWHGK